mmetsp:Transcript_3843/g.7990  ORF Transcript_3843/g.7990 Transcript_3843/m.7990 type:complete len:206 (+) Transcript_3843:224-841(+)
MVRFGIVVTRYTVVCVRNAKHAIKRPSRSFAEESSKTRSARLSAALLRIVLDTVGVVVVAILNRNGLENERHHEVLPLLLDDGLVRFATLRDDNVHKGEHDVLAAKEGEEPVVDSPRIEHGAGEDDQRKVAHDGDRRDALEDGRPDPDVLGVLGDDAARAVAELVGVVLRLEEVVDEGDVRRKWHGRGEHRHVTELDNKGEVVFV